MQRSMPGVCPALSTSAASVLKARCSVVWSGGNRSTAANWAAVFPRVPAQVIAKAVKALDAERNIEIMRAVSSSFPLPGNDFLCPITPDTRYLVKVFPIVRVCMCIDNHHRSLFLSMESYSSCWSLGSSLIRSQSPNRFDVITKSAMHNPGKTLIHQ